MSELVASEFKQLCVWPGTTLGGKSPKDFEKWASNEFDGVRTKFVEVVETLPDVEDGQVVPGTGGRSDLLFYVHTDDIGKFAIRRLAYGIRWWEDVLGSDQERLYSSEVLEEYPKTW